MRPADPAVPSRLGGSSNCSKNLSISSFTSCSVPAVPRRRLRDCPSERAGLLGFGERAAQEGENPPSTAGAGGFGSGVWRLRLSAAFGSWHQCTGSVVVTCAPPVSSAFCTPISSGRQDKPPRIEKFHFPGKTWNCAGIIPCNHDEDCAILVDSAGARVLAQHGPRTGC